MLQIAFVGCAHIHVPEFVRTITARTDVEIATMWDDDQRRSSYWAQRANARVAESPEAIYADDRIKAVIITSETAKHERLVSSAAQAGKHLFVEKPIGIGSRDANAIADAVEKADVIFQTGYFQRADPKLRFIKSLIESGALGRITKVAGSNAHLGAIKNWFRAKPDAPHEDWYWMSQVNHSGVGGFGDLGTHALDIVLWWLGEVALATGQLDPVTNTYGCDETGIGLMRFKSGAIGTISAGWVDHADPVKYLVSGTEGFASVINNELYVTSQKDERFAKNRRVEPSELPAEGPHAVNLFLDAILGKPLVIPLVTVREAAYRCAVMEAFYQGGATNTWVRP